MTDITVSGLRVDFEQILKYGNQIRLRYYGQTFGGAGSGYDNDVSLTQSGSDFYTSGIIQPLSNKWSSEDHQFLEQGRIRQTDSKLFVLGTVPTSGVQMKIGIGSPTTGDEYQVLEDGIIAHKLGKDEIVYKKLYVRRLITGSLTGE